MTGNAGDKMIALIVLLPYSAAPYSAAAAAGIPPDDRGAALAAFPSDRTATMAAMSSENRAAAPDIIGRWSQRL